ncbi:MAG: extracellular solute-binding protein, partial [Verrucomicrobia bacterium]|nr:extracellular solute-binding protein [Verrucomicrobiota bacterium]
EEFLAAAAAIRRLSRPGKEIWGFGIADPNLTALTSCYQHGGRLFSPDLLSPSLLSPQNIAGLDFLRELVARYRVAPPPESNDSWIGFRQGNIGMVLAGIWMLAEVRGDDSFPFDVFPLPQWGCEPASFGSTHLMAMAPDLQDASRQAAWRLVQFLSSHSLEWAKVGQLPARRSLLESPEFRNLRPQANLDEFYRAGEKVMRGTESASTALATAQNQAQRVVDRDRARHSQAKAEQ